MSETPAYDPAAIARLLEDLGGDERILGDLVRTYLDDAPSLLASMREALAGGRTSDFTRAAHTLKSTSVIFGAVGVAALARELEAMGRGESLGAAGAKIAELERACGFMREALATWATASAP